MPGYKQPQKQPCHKFDNVVILIIKNVLIAMKTLQGNSQMGNASWMLLI